jgi:hypothetical protein
MKAKHKANLLKLAAYLDTLPDDYERFDMYEYMKDEDGDVVWITTQNKPTCGTVACAIGHGPSAGVRVYGDTDWGDYADRVFGRLPDRCFDYMFSSGWTYYDNTPKGAAARIRTYVALGAAPEGWSYEDAKVMS